MSDRESPTSREAGNANVAAVRELYRTWNSGGPVAFCALLHPEVVWHELAELPGAGDHHGRPEVQRHLMSLVDTVGMFRASLEGIEERSGEVLAYLHLHDTLTPSGVPLDYRVVHLHRLREDMVDRIRAYGDLEQAIADGA
jgi:ketosteroid isomerase-like protein